MNANTYNYAKRLINDLQALVKNQQTLTEWYSELSENDPFRNVLLEDLNATAKAIDETSKRFKDFMSANNQ